MNSIEFDNNVKKLEKLLTAKYPNRTGNDDMDDYVCPSCNHFLRSIDDVLEYEKPNYCSNCAQKLLWKDAFSNGKIVKVDE